VIAWRLSVSPLHSLGEIEIARRYLAVRQMEANGVHVGQVAITNEALGEIIAHYTREAGFEISNARSARRCAMPRFASRKGKPAQSQSTSRILLSSLGRQSSKMRWRCAPACLGGHWTRWTPFGGDILFIEATGIRAGGFILTGQLGEVMRESAQPR